MKQRIYLPVEHAEILARNAAAVGLSPDAYVQHLILENHICGGGPAPIAQQQPAPVPVPDSGINLGGDWASMAL